MMISYLCILLTPSFQLVTVGSVGEDELALDNILNVERKAEPFIAYQIGQTPMVGYPLVLANETAAKSIMLQPVTLHILCETLE